jgi:cytochrome b561
LLRPPTYSALQIVLHWTIAALVIFQILFHDGIQDAHRAMERGEPYAQFNIHVIVGLSILALALWRLALRLTRGSPPPPAGEHPLLRLLATATHWAFYALLFIVPLSGITLWFFDVQRAGAVHELGKNLILALLALHIVAALTHHFVFKTNVFKRMLGRA